MSTHRMRRTALFTILASTCAPMIALAAPQTFKELVEYLVTIMNMLVPIIITAALVVYLFGISQSVLDFGGDKGRDKMKAYMFYGILIIFVMVSIWGILNLLQDTFFSSDAGLFFSPDDEIIIFDCGFGEC